MTAAGAAFLAFEGELMAGKILLPEYGGSAHVWCATVLFFQMVLLGGYYASRWMGKLPAPQLNWIVTGLGASGLFTLLPGIWAPEWIAPELQPLVALAPFGLLSLGLFTTTPLLHQRQMDRSDFTIFAWSNAGALAGLLSYPFVIEPLGSLTVQRWGWALGGCVVCAIGLRSQSGAPDSEGVNNVKSGSTRWQWWVLPAVSSATLLATTNQLSFEAGAGPLTWALPLAGFLATYVWAFSGDRTRTISLITAIGIASSICLAFAELRSAKALIFSLATGTAVMAICHTVLASTRSTDTHRFYVSTAIGGAIGSLFVVAMVPRVFVEPVEFSALTLGVLAFAGLWPGSPVARLGLTTLTVIAIGATIGFKSARLGGEVAKSRSLYGCLRVLKKKNAEVYSLVSNTTLHGAEDRQHPTREMTYFGRETGVGRIVTERQRDCEALNVGVIGLGTGTINRLLRPADRITYYEINPQVEEMARKYFTYLHEPETRVVIGDGRKSLEREPEAQFDILVLDAFTGDAIPTHLLTVESGRLYQRRLKKAGVLAIHYSNAHVELRPVIAGLARSMGMGLEIVRSERVDWAILRPGVAGSAEPAIEWTDERNSILPVLKWKSN